METNHSAPKDKKTPKPILSRMLLTLFVIYLLLCAAGCALQRKLIYFPQKLSPAIAEQAAAHEGFRPWKNSEGVVIGWQLPARGTSTGSVLVVHGNAGSALSRGYFAEPIHAAGAVDVFVLEYPGYGARKGAPSMKSFLAAADEAFETLPKGVPKYVVSESLGTGAAAHLAQTHPEAIAGMAMFVPYDSLLSLAKQRMPFLPVSLILLDRYEPAKWLQDYRGPIKFIVAEHDEVIPSKFGLRLEEGYRGPKSLEVVPGAHHNEVAGKSPEWWKEVFRFWQENKTVSPAMDKTVGR